jgi:hypothetical protein
MEPKEIIKSQYYASLEMLNQAIAKCPEPLWDYSNYKNKFWHIAYHALFYTHLYLQKDQQQFVPWSKHREHYQYLGKIPWPPHEEPKIGTPFSKDEVLEYLSFCRNEIETKVDIVDLTAESGFHWLPFSKYELQLYSIRHIQHHTGQLFDRLRSQPNVELKWIGAKPSK